MLLGNQVMFFFTAVQSLGTTALFPAPNQLRAIKPCMCHPFSETVIGWMSSQCKGLMCNQKGISETRKHACRCTGYSNLALGGNYCANVCMHDTMWWTGVPSRIYSWNNLVPGTEFRSPHPRTGYWTNELSFFQTRLHLFLIYFIYKNILSTSKFKQIPPCLQCVYHSE